MPPKKAAAAAKAQQKAAKAKEKAKAAEDKTFGLKNKNKSKSVQQYIKSIQSSSQNQPQNAENAARKERKEKERLRQEELNEIFKVAIQQPKVPPGVDPKSILCEYYRRGQCTKGFKCKFSHDAAVERKSQKIDIYSDKREEEEKGMEEWDQEELEKAVNSKHGNENKNRPTDIICKYFLDAIETKKYGWFWVCPNGGDKCQYRHALPPGYVLKSQMKQMMEDQMSKLLPEDSIEEERLKLSGSTPMTKEIFEEWKSKKRQNRTDTHLAEIEERKKKNILTGREIFEANPSLATGFDETGALESYEHSNDMIDEGDGDAGDIELSKEDEEALLDAIDDIELDDLGEEDTENSACFENGNGRNSK